MTEPLVREASVDDAPEIARVHVQAWRETYTRLLEPGELDDLSVEARTSRWAQIITQGATGVWIIEIDGRIAGFASAGQRQSHTTPELQGLYVLVEHHGTGAGQALMDAAIGTAPAFLFVAEDNPRAQAFYRRNGFTIDGVTDQHVLVRTPVPVVRMVR